MALLVLQDSVLRGGGKRLSARGDLTNDKINKKGILRARRLHNQKKKGMVGANGGDSAPDEVNDL